jgi:hypothetical protein
MLNVSARMSTNTGVAPRSANALAHDTKVNDGMMTSSPGCEVEQHRTHLERVGARRGQEHVGCAGDAASSAEASRGVVAVAGQVTALDGVGDEGRLVAGGERAVERDRGRGSRFDLVDGVERTDLTDDVRGALHRPEVHPAQVLADHAEPEQLGAGQDRDQRRQERETGHARSARSSSASRPNDQRDETEEREREAEPAHQPQWFRAVARHHVDRVAHQAPEGVVGGADRHARPSAPAP